MNFSISIFIFISIFQNNLFCFVNYTPKFLKYLFMMIIQLILQVHKPNLKLLSIQL